MTLKYAKAERKASGSMYLKTNISLPENAASIKDVQISPWRFEAVSPAVFFTNWRRYEKEEKEGSDHLCQCG